VNEDIVVPIAGMLFVLALVFGSWLMWIIGKRAEQRGAPRQFVEGDERLERIEHAIDAMAVEVERISEGQRFVTKLLSDRVPERLSIGSTPPRGG
jgi:hypothetical protein